MSEEKKPRCRHNNVTLRFPITEYDIKHSTMTSLEDLNGDHHHSRDITVICTGNNDSEEQCERCRNEITCFGDQSYMNYMGGSPVDHNGCYCIAVAFIGSTTFIEKDDTNHQYTCYQDFDNHNYSGATYDLVDVTLPFSLDAEEVSCQTKWPTLYAQLLCEIANTDDYENFEFKQYFIASTKSLFLTDLYPITLTEIDAYRGNVYFDSGVGGYLAPLTYSLSKDGVVFYNGRTGDGYANVELPPHIYHDDGEISYKFHTTTDTWHVMEVTIAEGTFDWAPNDMPPTAAPTTTAPTTATPTSAVTGNNNEDGDVELIIAIVFPIVVSAMAMFGFAFWKRRHNYQKISTKILI